MVLRIGFVLVSLVIGYIIGGKGEELKIGLLIGFLLPVAAIALELVLRRLTIWTFLGGVAGLFIGIFSAWLLGLPFKNIPGIQDLNLDVVCYVLLGYTGLAIGLNRGKNFTFARLYKSITGRGGVENVMIIDTSAIIDGRIADICETGFLDGAFIIPQFILHELQHIADSSDSLRRTRGRRGLNMLQRIQKSPDVKVRIVDEDFPRIKEVDAKLVALARAMNGKVITTDFNLNKVCEVQGIGVLNVNELANALRPVALPGESMHVYVLKEGKEATQGVAYLDDGTMVVVENGRRMIGKKLDVVVTSVLQTTAGRMIFAKPRDEAA